MNWKTKVAIQRMMDAVPFGQQIYFAGQKRVGGFRHFNIARHLHDVALISDALAAANCQLAGLRGVEIGSGWMPVVPIALWMRGLASCQTFDIARLMKREFVPRLIELLPDAAGLHSSQMDAHPEKSVLWDQRRHELLQLVRSGTTAESILDHCQIDYRAPVDTGALAVPAASVDVVFSTSVLEHVPAPEIHRIFSECQRVLRPGGLMVHAINLADHYADADPSISTINFLQYSSQEFNRYNTSFCFQNRLRASQYRQMMVEHGFTIVSYQTSIDPAALAITDQFAVHADFADLTRDDLCVAEVITVAQRA